MSDDVIDLAAARERMREKARELARRSAEYLESLAPRVRIYVDAEGDVCIDPSEGDVIIAWAKEDAVGAGFSLIALADPELADDLIKALRARRRRRSRPRDRG